MRQIRKNWQEIFFSMAGGKKTEYDSIVATDILDFWTLYDLWISQTQSKNQTQRTIERNKNK